MPRVASVGTALPPNRLTQKEARQHLERVYASRDDLLRLLRVLDRTGVEERYFAFPPEYYLVGRSFEERNADFVAQATELAARAATDALRKAGVHSEQVDHLFLVTTTGLATPSLDARLVARLGLSPRVRRSPIFGLGCAGGAGAISRGSEYLEGRPRERVLVVSVELCGQVFSTRALTPVDVVGAALFGDGAAACILTGAEVAGAGPRVLESRSILFEGTEDLMGWDFTSDGMRLILSDEIPVLVKGPLKGIVEEFLESSSIPRGKIRHWMLHPGGRKIMEAYTEAFGLTGRELERTREALAKVGNLSSASVIFILGDVFDRGRPCPGDKGLLCALGPGFAAELVLLGW